MGGKIIRDPIYGYIQLRDEDLQFIDTPAFQRLRRIRQSGCHTVYPSANHTRFEHSLSGNMVVVTRADYRFTKPRVYLNIGGALVEFQSLYRTDICGALLDIVRMVYVHPDIGVAKAQSAIRNICGVSGS